MPIGTAVESMQLAVETHHGLLFAGWTGLAARIVVGVVHPLPKIPR